MFVAVKGTTTFGDLPDCYGNIFIVSYCKHYLWFFIM